LGRESHFGQPRPGLAILKRAERELALIQESPLSLARWAVSRASEVCGLLSAIWHPVIALLLADEKSCPWSSSQGN
jgi:hypothetical protein